MKTRGAFLIYIFPAVLVVLLFLLYPLISLVFYGLRPSAEEKTILSFANYSKILTNRFYIKTIIYSIVLSLPTTIVAVFASLSAGWHIAEQRTGTSFLRTVFTFSYAFGGIVYGVIFVFLFGNVGIVSLIEGFLTNTSVTAGFAYTPLGLFVAYLIFQMPRSALFLASALEKMDRDIIPSSRTLGANKVQIFTLVLLPMFRKQVVSSIILIFSMSMASFGVALLIAQNYPIFTILIYQTFSGSANLSLAASMAIILFLAVAFVNMALSLFGGSLNDLHER